LGSGARVSVPALPGERNGREWIATVLDMETGDETTIGRIRLASAPGYNGYGKLIDDSANPRSFLGWHDATLAARTPG
jgi:hypothetical protein